MNDTMIFALILALAGTNVALLLLASAVSDLARTRRRDRSARDVRTGRGGVEITSFGSESR